jgi:hypothetical protein
MTGTRSASVFACLWTTVALLGCDRGTTGTAAQGTADSSTGALPAQVVDSVLPIEEELRRFRADIPGAPTEFTGGTTSRRALVESFVRAVERADTAALAEMVQSRAEFAHLTYPSSPYTRPPYRQSPQVTWMLLQNAGVTGLRRVVDRLAGRPVGYLDYECDAEPLVEGENRLWRNCRVRRVRAPADTVTGRLFGVILERNGRYKFASYANDL